MSAGRDPAEIRPLRVGDLPRFLAAIEPVLREADGGEIDWLGALARHADRLIEATAIGAEVERDWLEAQDVDTLVSLAARVLEVNADFFVRRVLPRATAAAEALARALDQVATVAPNAGTPAPATPMSPPSGGARG